MTRTDQYQTRSDGSIDYAFYLDRGHQIRSQGAHDVLRKLAAWLTGRNRPAPSARMQPPLRPRAGRPTVARPAPAMGRDALARTGLR